LENPTRQSKKLPEKKNNLWHWLIKHPVEFSRNKRSPQPTPRRERSSSRGNSPTLPEPFCLVKVAPAIWRDVWFGPTQRRAPMTGASGSGGDARNPADPAGTRPARCRLAYISENDRGTQGAGVDFFAEASLIYVFAGQRAC